MSVVEPVDLLSAGIIVATLTVTGLKEGRWDIGHAHRNPQVPLGLQREVRPAREFNTADDVVAADDAIGRPVNVVNSAAQSLLKCIPVARKGEGQRI